MTLKDWVEIAGGAILVIILVVVWVWTYKRQKDDSK